MNTVKITKRTNYETIAAILKAAEEQGFGLPDGMTFDGLNEFVENELGLLDKKAESAAKRAAAKREKGDALREKIFSVLTDEPQTLAEITAAVGDPQVTAQMVTPRLSQLINLEQVVKEQKTVAGVDGGKSRKVTVYKRS